MNTLQLIDTAKARHNISSDYAVAPLLGLTRAQVSRYRSGRDFMGDDVVIRACALIGVDPAPSLAHVHAERSKDEGARAAWLGIAKRLEKAAATTAAAVALLGFSGTPDGGAQARTTDSAGPSVYYVKRRKRSVLARVFHWCQAPLMGDAALCAA